MSRSMLQAIQDFLNGREAATPVESGDTTDAAVGPDRVQVAACALLLKIAYADDEFSSEERRHIEEALERHFGLDAGERAELIALAEDEHRRAIDDFHLTRVISANYDLGQKMLLAEIMWGVILADGEVARHERYLVRKLANLLDLAPAYLSQARRRVAPDE